jgi:serine/threonine protein kinase
LQNQIKKTKVDDKKELHKQIPLLHFLNSMCSSMAVSLLYFHTSFPGMVHNDIKPANFLCSFSDGKFVQAWDVSTSSNKTNKQDQGGLINALGKFKTIVLADFGISLPKSASKDSHHALSVGTANGTPWYRSPESGAITSSGTAVYQGNDIYSLAVSILSLCVGTNTTLKHQSEKDVAIAMSTQNHDWKNQQFVAQKITQLFNENITLFQTIFGDARTAGITKMLWFDSQIESYPERKQLAQTDLTRRIGLLMFLGEEEENAVKLLTQQKLVSPASSLELSLSQQVSQSNLTQIQAPVNAIGSRSKLYRGQQLVAQVNAKINLGFNDESASDIDTEPEVSSQEF